MNWKSWTGCYKVSDYDWVLSIREQCVTAGITFFFRNTGSLFKQGDDVRKVNPFKQNSFAKELDISIMNGNKQY